MRQGRDLYPEHRAVVAQHGPTARPKRKRTVDATVIHLTPFVFLLVLKFIDFDAQSLRCETGGGTMEHATHVTTPQ